MTIGREFDFKKERVLQVGTRVLLNGGSRYTPLDENASPTAGRYIGDVSQANSAQVPNYFRIDGRIAYRYNGDKLSGTISLDIQNILNRENPNGVGYTLQTNSIDTRYHSSGLVPVLAFLFDF